MVQVSNRGDEDQQQLLPVDGDGTCMACKKTPELDRTVTCGTCNTPWHVDCLVEGPTTLVEILSFICPDCSGGGLTGAPAPVSSSNGDLVTKIRAIEADGSLTEREKAKKRQELFAGKGVDKDEQKRKGKEKMNEALALLSQSIKCSFCMQLPERPVTTPCGHNFCLKCFQKWIGQGKRTCAKCRSNIPSHMASQPRINSALVATIRRARMLGTTAVGAPVKVYHSLKAEDLPDESYVTERAKYGGIANAKCGRIFVSVPSDHFGPILAENDPVLNLGVLVGQCFANRHKSRQWGVHRPLVCGISGQANVGAQSVVLSGGYVDDEDHGEWFLYTGSGGRDLSGNKRTNKDQSFDQEFKNFNEALRVSCKKGYPVRVIRSYKEKRSSYAPEKDLRYDGIYRIEKCWRKVGQQGFKVCRYLFVRCDNEPAPWTSDEDGDCPRALPDVPELQQAIDIFERSESPSWDYDDGETCWKWKMPPPPSKEKVIEAKPEDIERARRAFKKSRHDSLRENLLKEFSCLLCKKVMNLPVTTPCAHNFCKSCLEDCFSGQAFIRERTCKGGRQLRAQKNCMKCPVCPSDISEFLQNMQVNREVMTAIEDIQAKLEEDEKTMEDSGEHGVDAEQESPGDQPSDTEIASLNAEDVGSNGSALKRKSVDGCLSTENKRQKADNGHGISDETENVHADANGSPSSPLHLRPNDEIFS
ncbi:E3 ubiquitin-protein ligase ORTHRUS 2-like [Coffea arabica]|uniref:RING-type E3 ubiquitin transferase n=1 Tax=Coffea arabica TaxID=13443 RepID=A0A6P6X7K9_COFAR|nr:E3 ubiquitin-protein ligase ORTHRUS 2-like [Coffea arabica]